MAEPKEFVVKTREQIRTDYTRTVAAGLVDIGIPNPNVSEGTRDYLIGDALGAFGEDIGNLVQIKANAALPDTAGKNDPEELFRIARIIKKSLRPAGPSRGKIILATSTNSPVGIPSGAQLVNEAGLTFEVVNPGPYSDGNEILCRSVDTGRSTNIEAGTTLRWVSPPPFVVKTAVVASGGFLYGVDQEDIEGLRERVIDHYANPPGGGNWAQVAEVAERSSYISRAFVYPGVYGGNTLHVCVVRAPTDTNKSREIDQATIDAFIAPDVIGEFPTFADIVVTSATDNPADISFELNLPPSRLASPPGPGGGWLDANPWPKPYTSDGFASVISVTSAVEFVLRAEGTPIVGSQIAYVSPVDFYVYHGVVQSVSRDNPGGFPNDWRIVVDTVFLSERATSTAIAVGDWVSPDAERFDEYVAAALSMFASLGPAEKTTSPGLLPRALRKPAKVYKYPADVGSYALRQMILSGEEVLNADFLVEPSPTPVVSGYRLAPKISIPRKLAFYAAE